MKTRIEKNNKYRKIIAENFAILHELEVSHKKLLANYKDLKKLHIPNLPTLDQKIDLIEHCVYELHYVQKDYQKIKKFVSDFDYQKVNEFIKETKKVLNKDYQKIFTLDYHNYTKNELINDKYYCEIISKTQKANELKNEFTTYKKKLEPNLKLLEKTLLKANEYLNSSDQTKNQLEIKEIDFKTDKKRKRIVNFFFNIFIILQVLITFGIITVFIHFMM